MSREGMEDAMKDKDVIWQLYRSEGEQSLVEKLKVLVEHYQKKMGHTPNVIGLPPGIESELVEILRTKFEVLVCVPAWASSEIWLGMDRALMRAEKEMN